jgi:parvulin-like peptidyl-prolyl isomerase
MRRTPLLFFLAVGTSAGLSAGCSSAPAPAGPPPRVEPERVVVQHVLVSFAGTRTKATRKKEEAEALAKSLLDRARKGEDFDALMKQYSDDTGPGIYALANYDARPGGPAGEFSRTQMVAAFGRVGFALEVGQVGLAGFDPRESPFGWHLIKRLK